MDGRGYEERLESGVSIQGAVIGPSHSTDACIIFKLSNGHERIDDKQQ